MANLLSKEQLLNVVGSAILNSGWNVLYLSEEHPFRLHIYSDGESYKLRVYIWNITHGGRSRSETEYRIQVTGVEQFLPEPGGKTLLLGWWNEVGVFAGWDFKFHQNPLGFSPSLQIERGTLEAAYQKHFSTYLKANNEIAVAFKPEFFVEYVSNLEDLHGFGNAQQDLEVLEAVAIDPYGVNDSDIEAVTPDRRIVVRSVQQRLRSSRFRERVLMAYTYSCAFCGLQLDLVQAAHIVPITHERSTDDTFNGIAACYLHHAAYDRALVTFDEQYKVRVNEDKVGDLIDLHRAGGIGKFRSGLRPLIVIPPENILRPHVDLVRLANEIRGWK